MQVLSNLNDTASGRAYYRYESGTSMAAADVSGVLALMQDYFTNTLHDHAQPGVAEGDAHQRRARGRRLTISRCKTPSITRAGA